MYAEKVREILAKHSRLDVDVNNLKEDDDLYDLGLTSLTTVNIMLAIEDAFDIEFPDSKLNRKTFNSIESLVEVIEELVDWQDSIEALDELLGLTWFDVMPNRFCDNL